MAFKVNIDVDRTITVSADASAAFALLSDVPASSAHFPKVDKIVDLGDDIYRWEMGKVGVGDHAIQTIYASQYESDEANGSIEWAAVEGEGNALVSGSWKLETVDGGTELTLSSVAELELPMPKLLKMAISPVVKSEFVRMVDAYVENIQKALDA